MAKEKYKIRYWRDYLNNIKPKELPLISDLIKEIDKDMTFYEKVIDKIYSFYWTKIRYRKIFNTKEK